MKRFLYLFLSLSLIAGVFAGCNKNQEQNNDPSDNPNNNSESKVVANVTQSALLDAVASWYATWEDETEITATMKVGDKELTLPQYQYAMAKALSNIGAGKSDDIEVLNYKAADHPERDSYDSETIAVAKGPADGKGETEDLVNIANRMMATMADKGQVPNQTLIYRGNDAIAFSTNRSTVCFARALAAYKKDGKLPASVETTYLSAASSMKGFAQEFVKCLDVWENTIGNVSADASKTSTRNTGPWENVHFVPIPWSGGEYPDGQDQYDPKYSPFSIEVAGTAYTAAECWDIALRGILDLITVEGSTTYQESRNTPVHTLGNGKPLTMPIPVPNENAVWGQYPWYEQEGDVPYPLTPSTVGCDFLVRHSAWALTRAFYAVGENSPLGKIGNFLNYGTDPDVSMVVEGYDGYCSAMRAFLIAARFYKYLLDNDIKENVYDAVKDVRFNADLYGIDMPDVILVTSKVTIGDKGTAVKATFNSSSDWTATPSESWIHVDPASGASGSGVAIMISADPNTGDEREGKVTIKGGNNEAEITVKQTEYVESAEASLKVFAQEFVKALDVWDVTVGTVESEGKHLIEKGTAWENVHFIPVGKTGGPYDDHAGNQHDPMYTVWKLNVAGVEYTSSQAWEIAFRGLFNLVTAEGEADLPNINNRNTTYTLTNAGSMLDDMPQPSPGNKWGGTPWYEEDDYYKLVTYNGAAITDVDVNFMVKLGRWHVVRSFIKTDGNDPLGNVGNFQHFGNESSTIMLDGYAGYISPMRELLILARIYKYILDNGIETNVYDAIKDQRFDFDLYNQGAVVEKKITIGDFAKEFGQAATKWQSTVGTIEVYDNGQTRTYERVHYVPEDFTITVKGKTYDKYQQHLLAMHALQALAAGEGLSYELDAPEAYKESDARYDEFGSPLQESFAKVDMLLNATERLFNYANSNAGKFPDAFGYPRGDVNLNGTVSVERFYLILSRWFKYINDKGITSDFINATKDVELNALLYDPVPVPEGITIKEFAQEFVKVLDVWEANVGTVDACGIHCSDNNNAYENVHFVPIGLEHKAAGDYDKDGEADNQYNKKYTVWEMKVGDRTINSAEAWEMSIRGLLDLLLKEGDGYIDIMTSRNEPALTLGNYGSLSENIIPEPTVGVMWGKFPWYEGDSSGNFYVQYNGVDVESAGIMFLLKCTICHVARGLVKNAWNTSPLGMIGNFQQFGTTNDTIKLDGYEGQICPMRELLMVARVYKYMLDNDVDDKPYTAVKDLDIDATLY